MDALFQKLILDSADRSIISTTTEGLITTFNRTAERWLGYRADEVIGKITPAVIHDPAEVERRAEELSRELGTPIAPGFEVFVAKAVREGVEEREWTYVRKDGSRFPVLLSVTAMRDEEGRLGGFLGVANDITARRQAELAVRDSQDRLFQFLEAVPAGVFVLDNQGRPYYANRASQELLGRGAVSQAAVGTLADTYRAVVAGSDVPYPAERMPVVRALAGETTSVTDMEIVRPDGRVPLQVTASPVRDGEGRVIYAIAAFVDTTSSRQAAEELRRAMAAAEDANLAKSRFLATMSHELRTPLNSIIGFTNILLKNKAGNLRDQDLLHLERVLDNGKHLLDLINEILDLSKIEAGKLQTEFAAVDLETLVRETLDQLEGQVRDRPVVLRAEVPPQLEALVADAVRLRQVLINLVGNALKFTESGSITVRVVADSTGRCPTAIEVEDTGIGIRADHLKTVFDAFEQADATHARRYGGTGLGLTISKALVETMGFSLEVESTLGRGSLFRILMGNAAAAAIAEAAPTAGQVSTRPLARKVLVIDDEDDSRLLLTNVLEECGCLVVSACSGSDGLAAARAHRPDLITLDLMMRGMNGWEVLRELKNDSELSAIPVVVVSIAASENRGTVFGAMDFVNKPVQRDELQRALNRNLLAPRDRVLIVEDDPDARRIISTHLTDEGLQVSSSANGREALEMLAEEPVDLIILDLMMPEMDGMSLLATLRAEPRYAQIPVVVVTARDLSLGELAKLNQQATAVLRKGQDIEAALLRTIRAMK